jgi:excisionase family DNA binding protein
VRASLSDETVDVLRKKGLLSPTQLAEYIGVPVDTVYIWNQRGSGPKFARVGKHVRYRLTDVESWLESRSAS